MYVKQIIVVCLLAALVNEGYTRSYRATTKKIGGSRVLETFNDGLTMRVFLKKVSYSEAVKVCEAYGGLVILNTRKKQNEVNNHINAAIRRLSYFQKRRLGKLTYWIGGRYIDNEGKWKWLNGEEIPLNDDRSEQWFKSQPNKASDDCVYMMKRKERLFYLPKRKWFDGNCNNKRYFICESMEVIPAEEKVVSQHHKMNSPPPEGKGTEEISRRSFIPPTLKDANTEKRKLKVHREAVQFEKAALSCGKYGEDGLFNIDSENALDIVHDQLRNIFRFFSSTSTKEYWVKSVEGDFQILRDEEATGECSYITAKKKGRFSPGITITAKKGSCTESRPFICQLPDHSAIIPKREIKKDVVNDSISARGIMLTEEKPREEFVINNNDWVIAVQCSSSRCKMTPVSKSEFEKPSFEIVFHRELSTYAEAKATCAKEGQLAALSSTYISTAIANHLIYAEPIITKLLRKNGHVGFWVGAEYEKQSKRWMWTDGSYVDGVGKWYYDGKLKEENKDCMFISSGASAETNHDVFSRGQWFSTECSKKKFFICHKFTEGEKTDDKPVIIDGWHEDWMVSIRCTGPVCALTALARPVPK